MICPEIFVFIGWQMIVNDFTCGPCGCLGNIEQNFGVDLHGTQKTFFNVYLEFVLCIKNVSTEWDANCICTTWILINIARDKFSVVTNVRQDIFFQIAI